MTRTLCPDGGTCHHDCGDRSCFRVLYCEPLTTSEWASWPNSVKRMEKARGRRYADNSPNAEGLLAQGIATGGIPRTAEKRQ